MVAKLSGLADYPVFQTDIDAVVIALNLKAGDIQGPTGSGPLTSVAAGLFFFFRNQNCIKISQTVVF
jgi:hypothetical protein